jgi:hypothetical protein
MVMLRVSFSSHTTMPPDFDGHENAAKTDFISTKTGFLASKN